MKSIILHTFTCLFFTLAIYAQKPTLVIGHEPKLTKIEEIQSSFDQIEHIKQKINKDSEFILFEGLPHVKWDSALLESELKEKNTITRYGFTFYQKTSVVNIEDTKKILSLIKSPDTLIEFRGYKKCGGFSPDFSLVYKNKDDEIEIHICFGCGEIKAYNGETEVYCDITSKSEKSLREILKNYNKQRPKKQ